MARVRALQALLAAVPLPVEVDPVEVPAESLLTDLLEIRHELAELVLAPLLLRVNRKGRAPRAHRHRDRHAVLVQQLQILVESRQRSRRVPLKAKRKLPRLLLP